MPRGFIFDMDGCLLDSIKLWHIAEDHIMEEAGVELTKDERDELNALTLEEAGQFFHERFGIMANGDEVVQAIIDFMLHFYQDEVEANPGAVDFVRALRDGDAKLCVLSSSPQAFLQAGLAHVGLLECFDPALVLSANDLGMVKRETATYDYVCGLMGCEAKDTWFFDDSWYACETAHAAGLRAVGVYSTDKCGTHEELGRFCDKVVNDFTELDVAEML